MYNCSKIQAVDLNTLVTGVPTAGEMEMLSSRFADDKSNMVKMSSTDALIDNNAIWCMAIAGGSHLAKQALMWCGALRNSGRIWVDTQKEIFTPSPDSWG